MTWVTTNGSLLTLSRALAWAGLILIFMAFGACHLDASPAESQLTHLVWLLLFAWVLPLSRTIQPEEIRFMAVMVILFSAALLSAWLAGDLKVEGYFRPSFIYLLPVGLLGVLSLFRMRKGWVVSGLLFAASMAFIVIIKDLAFGGVRGAHHGLAIPYGIFGLTTGLMCLLFAMDKSLRREVRMLLLAGAVCGFAACIWSQTRIAWLYAILWACAFPFFWLSFSRISARRIVAMVVVTVLALGIVYVNRPMVLERTDEAISDVTHYLDGTDKNTSVGQRLELWKVAAHTFAESPLLGAGESGFVTKRDEMNASNEVFVRPNLEHAHNDYLWLASTRGLLSLFFYLVLQVGLIIFYWQHVRSPVTRYAAFSGLTLTAGALFYGFSDIFFSVKISIGYYLIAQMVLIRLLCSESKLAAPESSV